MSARWKWWIAGTFIVIAALVVLVVGILQSGLAGRWVRQEMISQIEQRTGARVDVGAFHLYPWKLRIEIDNLTVHGLEGPGLPPLFHVDRVEAQVRIVSLLGRQIALEHLLIVRPEVAVEINARGRSNVPMPPKNRKTSRTIWQEIPFRLHVGTFELLNGSVRFNNHRTPLEVTGRGFDFTLQHSNPAGAEDFYTGRLAAQRLELAEHRWMPFRSDMSAKFTLRRDSFALNELVWKLPHSELDVRADLPSFARRAWSVRYRGRISFADLRAIFRKPQMPDGLAEFSGHAHYTPKPTLAGGTTSSGGEWSASGYYRAQGIRMRFDWFHAGGIATWGNFNVARRHLVVPNLHVEALEGAANGRLDMNFHGLTFRAQTRLRGASLGRLMAALNHPGFPVDALHWDGVVNIDSVNTWHRDFRGFESHGDSQWMRPATVAAGKIPVTAQIHYDYVGDLHRVSVASSDITTPTSQVTMEGAVGAKNSAMQVNFQANDLRQWDDFINVLRGPDSVPRRIAGQATWKGSVTGHIAKPTFAGHVTAQDASYGALYWDAIQGDMTYSPDEFSLQKTTVRRGKSVVTLNFMMQLDGKWAFLPSSTWSLDARARRARTDDLQALFGTDYPVHGLLSGDFRGGGTRAAPDLNANFTYDDIEAKGWHFDSLSAHLHLAHDLIQLSGAVLRRGSARVTGGILYRPQQREAAYDVTGTGFTLKSIGQLQNPDLPVGGQISFHVKASGPWRAPVGRGELRLSGLRVGTEAEGDFDAKLTADGRNVHLTLSSSPVRERLAGEVNVALTRENAISGTLAVQKVDLDPLIIAGLHLTQLTGHSTADGVFTLSGALQRPDSIEINADLSHIAFNYEFVQLTNDQDIRLTYRRNEVRIEQAHLHGPDTDFHISGSARFDRGRPLNFAVSGAVNLRLMKGMLPNLDAEGRANVNVLVDGTMKNPEVTGRASVRDASALYADFPVGLSKINGDFEFDKSRLVFDGVKAQAGGGQMKLSGNLTYANGPLRYQVTAVTSQVRIRYPTGMSWLAGGTVQLSGTTTGGVLSGRVEVQRLLFAQGVDVASFFASASQTSPGPPSASPFLQNLAFDVEAQTSPGARIEWTGAHIELDGNVRLRGTWDRPVLLGHIHLLNGEMPFHGNEFELTRGDINFANPFRLDPVLDVELTSTISQYQVTVDVTGPASRLSVNYRSDPPLPDTDIVALLAFGNPGQGAALGAQPGSAQNYGATALLSEAISSGIGGRIEHLFGISNFRVDPFTAGTATESNAAARVTIQEQVTHDLSVTYSTNAATTNQYQLIQVVYSVKRDLSVEFLRDINGTYGFDIRWVKHFK